ncbi:N-acetylmuramoyl-L-alanine amidase [bacterium]|nr:N-acetylmuramoyl-L-alanine amidase [bacterium]
MSFWRKFLSFLGFGKSESKPPVIEPPKKEEPIDLPDDVDSGTRDPVLDKKTKIAVIVGHTKKSKGASNYKGEDEFTFNSRIAEKIKTKMAEKYPSKTVKIFFREDGYYSSAVKKVGRSVGKWKAKISMELHFNSYKKAAYGCEVLVWEGAKKISDTVKAADVLTDNLADKFVLKERGKNKYKDGTYGDGVKILPSKSRGALNIKACNDEGVSIAMLIEPCFANIEQGESRAIFENEDDYAELLADELAKIDA